MIKDLKKLKYENTNIILGVLSVGLFPIFLLLPTTFINISHLLLSSLLLIQIFKYKQFYFFKNYFFVLLLFFFTSLLINIFFSQQVHFDASRQIGFFRIIFVVFAIKYFLNFNNRKYSNFIIKIWSLIFFIVTFDLIFEYIFGFDLIGNKSYLEGKLAGFLGKELKIGNYYLGFILITFSFFFYSLKKKFINYLILVIFLITSFLIGERANFFRTVICVIIFLSFLNELTFKIKISVLITLLISIIFFYSSNNKIKSRIDQILEPVSDVGIISYISSSHYGAHFDTAIKIFNKNKIFGIGLKQFRYESEKQEYKVNDYNIYNRENSSTHPHQIHFEFLAETGLFGYFCFLFFFLFSLYRSVKIYFLNKNKYLLSSIIFIIVYLIPIIPTGSFFTTYTASIFWINYAVMISFQNDDKQNSI